MRRIFLGLLASLFLATSVFGFVAHSNTDGIRLHPTKTISQVATPFSTADGSFDIADCCGGDPVKTSLYGSMHCGADCGTPLPEAAVLYPERRVGRTFEQLDIGNPLESGSVFRPPIG